MAVYCAPGQPASTRIVRGHLERRGYIVDLPTRNLPRKPAAEESVNQELQRTDKLVVRKIPWPGLQVPRYRWLCGDSAWLPAV
jgi:hypothetical protein